MRLDRTSFAKRLSGYAEAAELPGQPILEGRLLRMVGLTLEAEGLRAAMGRSRSHGLFRQQDFPDARGQPGGHCPRRARGALADTGRLPMGMSMLGRVLDGVGRALDGKGGMKAEDWVPMDGPTINPLNRNPISVPLDVGIRSINGLLTVGRGQRVGLFAGSGVGKSTLLGMMTRYTAADVIVVGLIGERGREVKEFIEHSLGEEGLKRSVVVASPADDAPLMRLRAAMYCTRIAEYFRDKGKNVLLLMDSLTRFAQASAKSPWPSANRPPPRAIRRRCSPSCRCWWNAPVMTSKTRLLTRRGACSTGTLCCRGVWPKRGITRPSISKRPSAG
ncbi:ATP synthase alpha/beta family, nucleotide-binding domain-containing protein [Ditylenchus destructor]|nr:ATP synthase alpha/beta family, nucleotide-binding domain-containing protein [Ditylenchus destructor]